MLIQLAVVVITRPRTSILTSMTTGGGNTDLEPEDIHDLFSVFGVMKNLWRSYEEQMVEEEISGWKMYIRQNLGYFEDIVLPLYDEDLDFPLRALREQNP